MPADPAVDLAAFARARYNQSNAILETLFPSALENFQPAACKSEKF
jgi:hypothetical protein